MRCDALFTASLLNVLQLPAILRDSVNSQIQQFILTAVFLFSRPGILVLINDADWELEGEATYALQANDNILFVSTLHGG